MKIFIIYQRYLDDSGNMRYIGGLQKYVEQLCALALEDGHELCLLQYANAPFERAMDEAGRFLVVGVPQKHRNWTRDLVAAAERLGDVRRDLLLFASSTQIVTHRFRRSLAIQHGVFWDVPTIHGKTPRFPLDLSLRAVQASRLIRQHKKVSRMICVDYNYVNWLRALTVDRSLQYRVIPNFTEIPDPEHRREDGTVRLLFARRFEEIRGVDLILDFIPRLLAACPKLTVTLAGGGSRESALRTRFSGEPRVCFATYAPREAVSFHKDYDIAIVPTIGSEGTSLSLLEAMAAGCTVVCSDVGGMTNIILDGYNGRMVAPDAASFEQAIRELIDDPDARRTLAERGRQTAAGAFSLERWQKQWRAVLNEFSSEEGG